MATQKNTVYTPQDVSAAEKIIHLLSIPNPKNPLLAAFSATKTFRLTIKVAEHILSFKFTEIFPPNKITVSKQVLILNLITVKVPSDQHKPLTQPQTRHMLR